MEILFAILETVFLSVENKLDHTSEEKIKQYIYNNVLNEDKTFMFGLILIVYIAFHDDEYLSRYEKEKIKLYLQSNHNQYSKQYNNALRIITNKKWEVEEVYNFMMYNKICVDDVKKILLKIQINIFEEERYRKVINELRENLSLEERYLRKMLTFTG